MFEEVVSVIIRLRLGQINIKGIEKGNKNLFALKPRNS